MSHSGSNLFLDALSPASRSRILSCSEEITLHKGFVLQEAWSVPSYVFLLTCGVVSQMVTLPEGTSVEVGLIGCEGLVGNQAVLGPQPSPNSCCMQTDGLAYRILRSDLRRIFLDSEDVRERVLAYTQAHTVASAHLSACNKLHAAGPRLARWLLMVHDRLGSDTLQVTQDTLALRLGTRRMTVGREAAELQRSGIIEYKRGQLKIFRRDLLEAEVCECYASIRAAYSNLYL
jgi:CRP-like cAMP-binding protein